MAGKCKHLFEETKTYCGLRPHYGYPNDNTTSYCAKHKLEGMTLITNKICENPTCNAQPSFNFEGLEPKYCENHMEDGMINVKNSKC